MPTQNINTSSINSYNKRLPILKVTISVIPQVFLNSTSSTILNFDIIENIS